MDRWFTAHQTNALPLFPFGYRFIHEVLDLLDGLVAMFEGAQLSYGERKR